MDQLTEVEDTQESTDLGALDDDALMQKAIADLGDGEEEVQAAPEPQKEEAPKEEEPEEDDLQSRFEALALEEARMRKELESLKETETAKTESASEANELRQKIAMYEQAFSAIKEDPIRLVQELGLDDEAGVEFATNAYYFFKPDEAPAEYKARFAATKGESRLTKFEQEMLAREQEREERYRALEQRLEREQSERTLDKVLSSLSDEFIYVPLALDEDPAAARAEVMSIVEAARQAGEPISEQEAAEYYEDALQQIFEKAFSMSEKLNRSKPDAVVGESKTLTHQRLSQAPGTKSLDDMDDEERYQLAVAQLEG